MLNSLKTGVYAYYVHHDEASNTKSLQCVFYDGVNLSGAMPCTIEGWGTPNIVAAPCVLWESEGQYAGDDTSKIHMFLTTDDGKVWWMTSRNGQSFTVNKIGLSNVQTTQKVTAALMKNTGYGYSMHVYFNNSATSDQQLFHAQSKTDWDFQSSEPVLLYDKPILLNWSCSTAHRYGGQHIVFNNQSDSAVKLIYLPDPSSDDPGNGTWQEVPPPDGDHGRCWHTPNLVRLNKDLAVTYQLRGGDNQLYYALIDKDGVWNNKGQQVPVEYTVNGPGCCAWGDRLYCFYQSSSKNFLYIQVYVDGNWLKPLGKQISGVDGVYFGIAAVAVHPYAP